jgi:hypothetical protein
MTEDEVEFVAAELAKAGGNSWYPGREEGHLLKVVSDRYRDRARLAIAALEFYKARHRELDFAEAWQNEAREQFSSAPAPDSEVAVGDLVVHRPHGEKRAYLCRVEKIENGMAYLVPELAAYSGWVPLSEI